MEAGGASEGMYRRAMSDQRVVGHHHGAGLEQGLAFRTRCGKAHQLSECSQVCA